MYKTLAKLVTLVAFVLISMNLGSPKVGQAANVVCGQVITENTTLDDDLDCGLGHGVIIVTNGTVASVRVHVPDLTNLYLQCF